MSKELRILTGRHAGCSAKLHTGKQTVGKSDDSQIFISDWGRQQPCIAFEVVQHAHRETLYWSECLPGGTADVGRRHLVRDLQPVRFGEIVICIGPAASRWPSDAVLLQQLFGPAGMIKRALSRHRSLVCSVVALGLAASIGLAAYASSAEPKAALATPDAQASTLAARLKALGIGSVSVVAEGSAIVVSGLLEDERRVRQLDALIRGPASGGANVSRRYVSAAHVAMMIQSGLGESGATVAYRGQGVFVVEGKVRSLDATRRKAARLASDMQDTVQGVEVAATEQEEHPSRAVMAVLADDTDPYVQTAEGVKHLGLPLKPTPSGSNGFSPAKLDARTPGLAAPAASSLSLKELP